MAYLGYRRDVNLDLSGLNEEQYAAVMHTEGPLLVLAGAGSGKTRVVTHRIARLLLGGVPGQSIIAVTFTNKAAREMRERLIDLVGTKVARGVILSTFHSLCARMLRRDAHRIDLSARFSILDTSDQLAQLMRVAKDRGIALDEVKPQQVLGRIGWLKNQGITDAVPHAGSEPVTLLAARLYGPYRAHLRALQAVDFDDLMLLCVEMLETCPDVQKRYQTLFQFMLIDEYQDTNPIQMKLVRLLIGPHHNLCVVGDDDQAIYGFRGSDTENILNFDSEFAPCTVVKLEKNYRSVAPILHTANALIAKNVHRRDKMLRPVFEADQRPRRVDCEDGEQEAAFVGDTIARVIAHGERNPEDISILYRANPQSRPFESALREREVPYRVVGGQEFFERRDVKNTLAYLHLMNDPDNEIAFRRVVNLPSRGIGNKSVRVLLEVSRAAETSPLDIAAGRDDLDMRPAARAALRRFGQILLKTRAELQQGLGEPAEIIAEAVYDAGMRAVIDREPDLQQKESITEAVEEVIKAFSSWADRVDDARESPDLAESWLVDKDAPPLQTFLERIALDEDERRKEQERKKEDKSAARGRVTLMSLHASKGLEFPLVFMVGMEEGLLPHRRVIEGDGADGIEEERRLCYVGITRAQKELYLVRAKARRRRRQMVPRTPSRFLTDIPEALIELSDERGGAMLDADDAAAAFFSTLRGDDAPPAPDSDKPPTPGRSP